MNYRFVKVSELAEYIFKHQGKDIGFTADTPEDVRTSDPSMWYGVKLSKEFDENTLLFGEYGIGVVYHYSGFTNGVDDIIFGIREFFDAEFSQNINKDYLICVDPEDFPVVEVNKKGINSYEVLVEGKVCYENLEKETANIIADAINMGIDLATKEAT